MKIISFHLKGKMAHFRKYYSNSSALSYFVPPRTTVCGIIAGLLGLDRDGYYEMFSLDNCKIAITSYKPVKKNMQKMNYLMIKSSNDLNGSQEHHSQTPIELVIPQNIRKGYIDYKVWIYHRDKNIMQMLEKIFVHNEPNLYKSLGACLGLGSAYSLGWIELEGIIDGYEVNSPPKDIISSSIPVEKIIKLRIDDIIEDNIRLIKEEIPLEFDKNRRITERGLKEVLVNINGGTIPAVVDIFIKLSNGENIVWLE